ncbi:MAG: VCBS repeat-containing protein [Myxococcota bacterium]|nr:VCBS repeat-containing protein [Myxococcota bacterium]
MFIFLFSCSEYDIYRDDKTNTPSDSGSMSTDTASTPPIDAGECTVTPTPPEEIGIGDACPNVPVGGFDPIVEWTAGNGQGCLSLPVVADINQDGMPDVVLNLTNLFNSPGSLTVVSGNGGATLFSVPSAMLAYGSPLAVGDIDNDGDPEIIGIREYTSALFNPGDYTAVAFDHNGQQIWESEHYINLDFNWATAPTLADMNGDGTTEIIVGRVILNSDGSTRGVGQHGLGSYGIVNLGQYSIVEGAVPAVTDLDLDGEMEIIVGNARYDIDGNAIFYDPTAGDAMIAIADLDSDPEGEIIGVTGNTLRAIDTDGTVIWGPITYPEPANILSPPTIADVDKDGFPEILSAGGNELRCYNHDGSLLWSANVVDESGATGASVFDFEGDGSPEVIYIDEQKMHVFEGPTGGIKFSNPEHASNTMFDYPVIADIDNDDQAEILVCHNGYSSAFSVYGDLNESWMPARSVWNQHAYHINNIQDNLQIPALAEPSFIHSNTYHSAVSTLAENVARSNVEAEILEICTDECANGNLWLSVRLRNTGDSVVPAGTQLSIYALDGNAERLVDTFTLSQSIDAGWTSESFQLAVPINAFPDMSGVRLRADDDGSGTGSLDECAEQDNMVQSNDAICP